MHLTVDLGNAVKVGLRHLSGTHFSLRNRPGQRRSFLTDEVALQWTAHASSSRMRGTLKRSSSTAAAAASASSRLRHGAMTSGRKTFTRGTG